MAATVKTMLKVIAVAAVFALAILFSAFYAIASDAADVPGIPEGVRIDDTDVGGMSWDAAQRTVLAQWQQQIETKSVQVTCGGVMRVFTAQEAGAQLVLDEAMAEVEALMQGDMLERLDKRMALREGLELHSGVRYTGGTLDEVIEAYADEVNIPPVNATLQMHESGDFAFTDAVPGQMLDEKALYQILLEKFEGGDLSAIEIIPIEVPPALTREELESHMTERGVAQSIVEGTKDRKENVRLITDAVNGQMVLPGQVLSLNELTGQRTPEKGYKEAPAIKNGKLIDDTGGGVCQLAGTLYNAALLSEMEIVERHRHTWPAAYLPVGQDATITWPNKDLKLRNPTDAPMYVRAELEDDVLSVTIFGIAREDDLEIRLHSEIIEKLDPPAPSVSYDDTKSASYRRVVEAERTGYRVKVYRQYYRGEELVHSEEISSDRYNPIRGKIIQGSKVEVDILDDM